MTISIKKIIYFVLASTVAAILGAWATDVFPQIKIYAAAFFSLLHINLTTIFLLFILYIPLTAFFVVWSLHLSSKAYVFWLQRNLRKEANERIKHAPWTKSPERCFLCGSTKIEFLNSERNRIKDADLMQSVWNCRSCHSNTYCTDIVADETKECARHIVSDKYQKYNRI